MQNRDAPPVCPVCPVCTMMMMRSSPQPVGAASAPAPTIPLNSQTGSLIQTSAPTTSPTTPAPSSSTGAPSASPTDGSQFVELYSSGKCCNNANNGYVDSTTTSLEECKQRCEDLSCTYFTYHSGLYASEPSEQGSCKTVTGECKEYDHPRCGDNICQVYQRATPAPTSAPTTPPITPAPTPAPTVPLNSQTAGCWAPAHGTSEDYNVYVDATSTHSAVRNANANGLQDGDPWVAAVTGPCAACVKSSLLIGGNQTRSRPLLSPC